MLASVTIIYFLLYSVSDASPVQMLVNHHLHSIHSLMK